MAKGQMRGNKEAKKPKADQDHPKKAATSAYQQSQGKGGSSENMFTKKS